MSWFRLPVQRPVATSMLFAAIVLLGVIAGLATPGIVLGIRAYEETTTDIVTRAKLRHAVERMARELREVRYNTVAEAYDLVLTANTATFTKLDRDGTTPIQVTIDGSSANVMLAYDTNPNVNALLVDQATSCTFTGYQADGTTVTVDPAQIGFVEVNLTLQTTAYVQRARVSLRNKP